MSEEAINVIEYECEYMREVIARFRFGELDICDVTAAARVSAMNIMRCHEELTEEAHHGG